MGYVAAFGGGVTEKKKFCVCKRQKDCSDNNGNINRESDGY